MNVHALETVDSAPMAGALKRFERQFTYPLGSGRSFRISHGDDYVRFFRAMARRAVSWRSENKECWVCSARPLGPWCSQVVNGVRRCTSGT